MTWRDLGRWLTSPRGVLAALAVAATGCAVVALAYVLGAATHPAVGWLVVLLAVGGPAAWAGRKAVDEHLRREAAAARARMAGEQLPDDVRGHSAGRSDVGRIQGGDENTSGAPPRTW